MDAITKPSDPNSAPLATLARGERLGACTLLDADPDRLHWGIGQVRDIAVARGTIAAAGVAMLVMGGIVWGFGGVAGALGAMLGLVGAIVMLAALRPCGVEWEAVRNEGVNARRLGWCFQTQYLRVPWTDIARFDAMTGGLGIQTSDGRRILIVPMRNGEAGASIERLMAALGGMLRSHTTILPAPGIHTAPGTHTGPRHRFKMRRRAA